jgi:hypothetical protein
LDACAGTGGGVEAGPVSILAFDKTRRSRAGAGVEGAIVMCCSAERACDTDTSWFRGNRLW